MDTDTIVTIAAYVLPFVLGWLMKAPWMKRYVPPWLADLVRELNPTTTREIYEKIKNKQARHEAAVEIVRSEVYEHLKIDITPAQADELISYLERAYRQVKK